MTLLFFLLGYLWLAMQVKIIAAECAASLFLICSPSLVFMMKPAQGFHQEGVQSWYAAQPVFRADIGPSMQAGQSVVKVRSTLGYLSCTEDREEGRPTVCSHPF